MGKDKQDVVIMLPPAFLTPSDAAAYLGYSYQWLHERAVGWTRVTRKDDGTEEVVAEDGHDLFQPSIGRGNRRAARYHIDHLDIISDHLMSPETFSADAALRAWKNHKSNRVSRHLNNAKSPSRKANKERATS